MCDCQKESNRVVLADEDEVYEVEIEVCQRCLAEMKEEES
jgi:hypothetical protein